MVGNIIIISTMALLFVVLLWTNVVATNRLKAVRGERDRLLLLCEKRAAEMVDSATILDAQAEPEILTPDRTGLWSMSGGLRATREAIRHNLDTFKFRSKFRYAVVNDAYRVVNRIETYYRTLDNLQLLNGDSAELRQIRELTDMAVGVAQVHLSRVVNFCALFDVDEATNIQAANDELALARQSLDELNEMLHAFAKNPPRKQQQLIGNLTDPDEFDRLCRLADQLITGARGEQMVSISEIYPEPLTAPEARSPSTS